MAIYYLSKYTVKQQLKTKNVRNSKQVRNKVKYLYTKTPKTLRLGKRISTIRTY